MRFGPGPAILAVILSFTVAPAWAEDCPAKSTGMDDIIAAVNGMRPRNEGGRGVCLWRER